MTGIAQERERYRTQNRQMHEMHQEALRIYRQLGARCVLLEAAMAVVVKHDLLNDLVTEHARIVAKENAVTVHFKAGDELTTEHEKRD